MKREPIREGDIVLSRAGRDSGRAFVVTSLIDDNYVLLVDGQLRTIDRPKKKKRMHLLKASEARMELSGHLLDADFRKFLTAQGYPNNRKNQ
jgi:ribosomal protein L14E/L6E/L27E